MKKQLFLVSLILFFILNILFVNAFIISPADINIDYVANQNSTASFSIRNNDATPADLIVYVEGDLNKSFGLSDKKITINPGSSYTINFNVLMPSNLKPGDHQNLIKIEQATSNAPGGVIGIKLSVGMLVNIKVPYPGKYIEASLSAENVAVNDPVKFKVYLENKGKETVKETYAILDIYDENNVKIGSARTGSISLLRSGTASLETEWNSRGYPAAAYTAKGKVYWDGNESEIATEFKIGDILIEIVNITGVDIKKNSISRIDIEARSKWNAQIRGIYAEIEILKDGNVLRTAKSQTTEINGWGKTTIPVYLDVIGLQKGFYDARAVVYYATKTADKKFIVNIKEDYTLLILVVAGVVLLLIINLIIVLYMLKRKRNEKKKK